MLSLLTKSLPNLTCSGFGFVTYKTVEAAKKAIDDPNKTLGVSRIMHATFLLLQVVLIAKRPCLCICGFV